MNLPHWCFIACLLARFSNAEEFIEDSQLLTSQHLSQLRQYMSVPEKKFRLLYRATRDGMTASKFHSLCDKQGSTITIGREATKGTVYGGYRATVWKGLNSYTADKNAFIFRLCGSECTNAKQSQSSTGQNYAVYDGANYGPTFGGGHDLIFFSGSRNYDSTLKHFSSNGYCHSGGHSYNGGSLGCGSNVKWVDIEVYGLIEFIEDSKLLTLQHLTQLQKYMRVPDKSVKLKYRATRDGMSAPAFHQNANKVGATITIGREATTGTVYGGFTSRPWKSNNNYGLDTRAFLFRLCGSGCTSAKFNLMSTRSAYAVYDHSNYGATFGGGHDLMFFSGSYSYNTSSKYFATNGYCSGSDNTYDGGSVGCGSNVKWVNVETYSIEEYIEDSNLLSTQQLTQLRQYMPGKKMKLLYRATIDGMSSNAFHSLCDKQGPTLTVGREATNGTVYAGYASRSWRRSNGYASDSNAFLLRLCGPECTSRKFNQKSDRRQYAIYDHTSNGPEFGAGHDLAFFDQGTFGYNPGSKYFATNGYCSVGDNTYDGGSVGCGSSVKWTDVEVYGVEESIESSKLLSDKQVSQIRQYLPNSAFKLLYRATGDGMVSSVFHQLCDNKGPTITIGREATKGTVYGGYAFVSWGGNGYQTDLKAFLFRMCGSECSSKRFNQISSNSKYALYHYSSYGPTFGGGHDLMFFTGSSNYNAASKYFPTSGYCYEGDHTYSGGSLGCGRSVKWSDIEVYSVTYADGSWSTWTDWGSCSKSCGGGIQSRTRSCKSSMGVNEFRNCSGDSVMTQQCNKQSCTVASTGSPGVRNYTQGEYICGNNGVRVTFPARLSNGVTYRQAFIKGFPGDSSCSTSDDGSGSFVLDIRNLPKCNITANPNGEVSFQVRLQLLPGFDSPEDGYVNISCNTKGDPISRNLSAELRVFAKWKDLNAEKAAPPSSSLHAYIGGQPISLATLGVRFQLCAEPKFSDDNPYKGALIVDVITIDTSGKKFYIIKEGCKSNTITQVDPSFPTTDPSSKAMCVDMTTFRFYGQTSTIYEVTVEFSRETKNQTNGNTCSTVGRKRRSADGESVRQVLEMELQVSNEDGLPENKDQYKEDFKTDDCRGYVNITVFYAVASVLAFLLLLVICLAGFFAKRNFTYPENKE